VYQVLVARDPDGPQLEAVDPLFEVDGPHLEAGDPLLEADGPEPRGRGAAI